MLIARPVVSVIFFVPVASYKVISIGKYFILLKSLPYSAIRALKTDSVASVLSDILMVKLSEEPFTVTDTTPVLESPFLSITTVVPLCPAFGLSLGRVESFDEFESPPPVLVFVL